LNSFCIDLTRRNRQYPTKRKGGSCCVRASCVHFWQAREIRREFNRITKMGRDRD